MDSNASAVAIPWMGRPLVRESRFREESDHGIHPGLQSEVWSLYWSVEVSTVSLEGDHSSPCHSHSGRT